MTTAHEALRQCVEAMKEVDFADCGKDDARWHKLNAAQQVAEEVLKRPEQKPVGYVNHYSSGSVGVNGQAMLSLPHGAALYAAPIASQQAAPTAMSQVFKGADGLKKLVEHNAFWEAQPYGTRLYFGDGIAEYLHRDVLRAAVRDLESQASALVTAPQPAAAPSGDAWISVNERLPEPEVLVAVYSPPTEHDWPGSVNINLDCIDPNDDDHKSWLGHNNLHEEYCCIAKPEGSIGPSADAPYTHWHAIAPAPAATKE